jgi:DNA-binding XRE family transcriptional regulator
MDMITYIVHERRFAMSTDIPQFTPQFIEPTDTIKVAARDAVLQEIEAIGSRRKQLLSDADDELERLAAFLRLATTAGLRQTEIADRAGVSRQTLINLRNEGRGTDREWDLDLQAMVVMAFQGPQTVASLASCLAATLNDEAEVQAAVNRLVEAGVVAWAGAAMSGDNRQDYFRLSAEGVEELPSRLRRAAIPENKRWTAYVSSSQNDAERLADIGQSILGQYRVGVIPANTVKGMSLPEIAFEVEAPGLTDAISRAAEFYEQLRARAGLEPEPARVTAVVPPTTRVRARGPLEADFERLRSDLQVGLPPKVGDRLSDTRDIADLAERVPSAAIVEAHRRIEHELREVLNSIGEKPSKSDDAGVLARQAAAHGLLSPETVNAVDGASVMRNLAVHGPPREISSKQAREYVAIADAVLFAIRQNRRDKRRN